MATSPVPEWIWSWPVMHGGGLEASRRLKDRSEARMRRVDRIAPGHALTTHHCRARCPDLRLARSRRRAGSPTTPSGEGDVNTLVFDLARSAASASATWFGSKRSGTTSGPGRALNLVDAALVERAARLIVDHVWNGEASVRVRWLTVAGCVCCRRCDTSGRRSAPVLRRQLLQERDGRPANAYVRWTERIGRRSADRRWSLAVASGYHRRRSLSVTHDVVPTIELDVWSHTTDGAGVNASDWRRDQRTGLTARGVIDGRRRREIARPRASATRSTPART